MQQDARSARFRPRARLLSVEPLEDRHLLSGISLLVGSQAPLPLEQGTDSAVVRVSEPEAGRATKPSSNAATAPNDATPDGDAGQADRSGATQSGAYPSTGTTDGSARQTDTATQGATYSSEAYPQARDGATGATTAPHAVATGTSDSYSPSQPTTTDPTPGDDRGTAYGTAGQSENYARRGAANPTSEVNTYAAYGQQAPGVTLAVQVAPVAPVRPQLSDQPTPGAAHATGTPQPTASSLSAEAAKGITDPSGAVRFLRTPDPGGGWFVAPLDGRTPEEIVPDVPDPPVEYRPETARALPNGDPTDLAAQLGSLLEGTLPVDLTALNQAANEFFGRLESLADEVWALPATERLTRWVVLALTLVGAVEFARRRRGSSESFAESAGGGNSDWDFSTVLALFPPEDAP